MLKPTHSIVERLLEGTDPHKVIVVLQKAYGPMLDKRELLKEFYNMSQSLKEAAIGLLNRPYLHLEKCIRAGVMERIKSQ